MSEPGKQSVVRILSFLALCWLSSLALAEDSWQDRVNVNGFFTLGVSEADSDGAFAGSRGGARNFDKDKPTLKNSLIGAQLDISVTDSISAVVQGSAYYRPDGSATSSVDWAYLNIDLGRDYSLRLGQFQTPFLQGVELKSIGYTRLWTRPMVPGSGASGFNEYRGAELVKDVITEAGNWTIQLAVGEADHALDVIEGDLLTLASVQYNRDDSWLRLAVANVDYEMDLPRVQTTVEGDVTMASMEGETRIGEWEFYGGFSKGNANYSPDDSMQYLSLARSFSAVTPYVFYNRVKQHWDSDIPAPQLPPARPPGPPGPDPVAGRPPPPPPPAPPQGSAREYSLGAGVRWDFADRLAIKFQVEDLRRRDQSRANVAPLDTTVYSLSLEGLF